MKPTGLNRQRESMLDLPSLNSDYCVVCGAYLTDGHHVIQKGMGGVSKEIDNRIPRISVCRICHNMYHAKKLHFHFNKKWLWFISGQPMSDEAAWEQFSRHYTPATEPIEYITFGRN